MTENKEKVLKREGFRKGTLKKAEKVGVSVIAKDEEEVKFTVEELKHMFPVKKKAINDDVADLINGVITDPQYDKDTFIQTLIDFQHVMVENRAGFKLYIDAIKFVGYLEEGYSLHDAYINARSNDEFVRSRRDAPAGTQEYDAILAAASRFRKHAIVRQLLRQSILPINLLFHGDRIRAVAVLSNEMVSAKHSKDRIAAAKELLAATKGADEQVIDLNVGPTKEAQNLQKDLIRQLEKISKRQYEKLQEGEDIIDVQQLGITVADGGSDGQED